MDTELVAMDAPPGRFLRQLDFGNQAAARRVRTHEPDASRFAYAAAPAVTTDHVLRATPHTIRQDDIDAGLVLHDSHDFPPPVDRHTEPRHPVRENALDVCLPQSEHVVVPAGEVAEVELYQRKSQRRVRLAFREKTIRDA